MHSCAPMRLTCRHARPNEAHVVTLGDVLFEVDPAQLKPGAARVLEKLARALTHDPNATVEIDRNTDSAESRQHNIDILLRRALSVKDYAVAKGIDAARVNAHGSRPDYPPAASATSARRRQNRRVEFTFNITVARLQSTFK